ncbi:hypothetical protein HCN51_17455 [Nonomuraea sp. FMUSA5-5]|uniref:DUF3558 domain-containing protein n=1 Tax=Nonomuraea composti TaxID=2720023 RepID=A0ABX1B3U4_9ACTN|nr:hypothetical protein [Nonomuraea sp. FMUSA5-5]NJP91220.1 hypothetical protein [Nonomuraea sp. FMUSA5-5]
MVGAFVQVTGCIPDKPPQVTGSFPAPVRAPVADRPPYLCYFVPQAAVTELTGYAGTYHAGDDKRNPDSYSCVISNDEQSLFITSYDVSATRGAIERYMTFGKKHNPADLPKELGTGLISDFDIRLYPYRTVEAWFRCGSKNALIGITVKRNPARDQDHDLVQLMKIAQRRFAEMFGCDLGEPPPR